MRKWELRQWEATGAGPREAELQARCHGQLTGFPFALTALRSVAVGLQEQMDERRL